LIAEVKRTQQVTEESPSREKLNCSGIPREEAMGYALEAFTIRVSKALSNTPFPSGTVFVSSNVLYPLDATETKWTRFRCTARALAFIRSAYNVLASPSTLCFSIHPWKDAPRESNSAVKIPSTTRSSTSVKPFSLILRSMRSISER